jgi:hypothetical protein
MGTSCRTKVTRIHKNTIESDDDDRHPDYVSSFGEEDVIVLTQRK